MLNIEYNTVLFKCSKRSQIKFYTLSNNENSQEKRITTDCYESFSKNVSKIYRNCTKEPYFFTIDTTLPADNPKTFRKNFSDSLL